MPLNIGVSGSLKPYAKYNSKADKWFAKGEGGDIEIQRPTFIADFKNIATGWLRFREGQAPERTMDVSLQHSAPNPGQDFKRGFVLHVFSQKYFGGLAELSSASIHMGNAIREAYQQFEEQAASNPGLVPVLECVGSETMKDKFGTNYRPKLVIVKWAERPADLPDASPIEQSEIWQDGQAAKPSYQSYQSATPVAPPAPVTNNSVSAHPLSQSEF